MKAIQHGTEWFPAFAQAEAHDGHRRQAAQRERQGAATYSVIRNRRGPPGSKQFSFDKVVTSKLPLADAKALRQPVRRRGAGSGLDTVIPVGPPTCILSSLSRPSSTRGTPGDAGQQALPKPGFRSFGARIAG